MSNMVKKLAKKFADSMQRTTHKEGEILIAKEDLICQAHIIPMGTEVKVTERYLTDYTVEDKDGRWMTEVEERFLCTKEEWEQLKKEAFKAKLGLTR